MIKHTILRGKWESQPYSPNIIIYFIDNLVYIFPLDLHITIVIMQVFIHMIINISIHIRFSPLLLFNDSQVFPSLFHYI